MEELSNKQLESITGGVIFDASNIVGSDYYHPWEVLDEKGNVVKRCTTREEAIFEAGKSNKSYMEITWEQVMQLRRQS